MTNPTDKELREVAERVQARAMTGAEQSHRDCALLAAHALRTATAQQEAVVKESLTTEAPEVLFDSWAVYCALTDKARQRTSANNVSDVLDAVVFLIRGAPIAQK